MFWRNRRQFVQNKSESSLGRKKKSVLLSRRTIRIILYLVQNAVSCPVRNVVRKKPIYCHLNKMLFFMVCASMMVANNAEKQRISELYELFLQWLLPRYIYVIYHIDVSLQSLLPIKFGSILKISSDQRKIRQCTHYISCIYACTRG